MATFYTDDDLAGAGEFAEAPLSLATEFVLPAGTINRFRWRFSSDAPLVTPGIRLYDEAGALLVSVPFDTAVLGGWNWATPGSPVSVPGGAYWATVTTTSYLARPGFFSGGPMTRGDITAVQGRFASGDAVPASTSAAAYFVDIDFTAAAAVPGRGSAAAGVDLAVTAAGSRRSAGAAAATVVLVVAAAGRAPEVEAAAGTAGLGLALTVAARGRAPGDTADGATRGETVTIVRTSPGGTDPYGDPLPGAVERIPMEGCIVADGATSVLEPSIPGRDPVITDYIVLPPADAPEVLHTDQIEVRGLLCDVVGRPFRWDNPFTGTRFGQQVRANVAEG